MSDCPCPVCTGTAEEPQPDDNAPLLGERPNGIPEGMKECPDCGGYGTGPDYMNGPDMEQGPCPICKGKGLVSK